MSRANTEIPCYVGFCSCGAAVFARVNDPADKGDKALQRDIAKEVARCIRDGLTIETRSVGWVRENLKFCDCSSKKRKSKA